MVNTCSVYGCHSEKEQTKAAVFKFPKENTELRQRWLRFINKKNVNPNSSYLFICERHFEEKYLNKQNNQRVRLCNAKNPVPTIHPPSIVKTTPSVLPNLGARLENLQKQEFMEKMKSTAKHSNPWRLQLFQRSMSLY